MDGQININADGNYKDMDRGVYEMCPRVCIIHYEIVGMNKCRSPDSDVR